MRMPRKLVGWMGRVTGRSLGSAQPSPAEGAAAPATRNVARGTAALSAEDIDWFHSIDLGEGRFSAGVKSHDELSAEFSRLRLDEAGLRGRTVLDVGCADGWNSLRCEQMGGRVTAIDGVYRDGLRYVRRALRPRFRFVQVDVMSSSFLELGTFDVVLYLGVLYHTPHPYEQLVRVSRVCRGVLYVESAYLNLPGHEGRATITSNFDGKITPDMSSPSFPSVVWIVQALRRIGFRSVEVVDGGGGEIGRVVVRASDIDPGSLPMVFAAEQTAV
jgi:tRNA (mo5U34)-methyltransferase